MIHRYCQWVSLHSPLVICLFIILLIYDRYDLESLRPGVRKITDHSEKYLFDMGSPKSQVESKFAHKVKDEIVLINEQFKQLNKNYTKAVAYLEEAHRKSAKVDNLMDALDHWFTMKDQEIPEDEGGILIIIIYIIYLKFAPRRWW